MKRVVRRYLEIKLDCFWTIYGASYGQWSKEEKWRFVAINLWQLHEAKNTKNVLHGGLMATQIQQQQIWSKLPPASSAVASSRVKCSFACRASSFSVVCFSPWLARIIITAYVTVLFSHHTFFSSCFFLLSFTLCFFRPPKGIMRFLSFHLS